MPLERDLSIFQKLNLDKQPVGVKFLYAKPEGVARLDKTLGLCEMISEAQTGKVFYADCAVPRRLPVRRRRPAPMPPSPSC